jgi:hypothetical protein
VPIFPPPDIAKSRIGFTPRLGMAGRDADPALFRSPCGLRDRQHLHRRVVVMFNYSRVDGRGVEWIAA